MSESKWIFVDSIEQYLAPMGFDGLIEITGAVKFKRWGRDSRYWYTSWTTSFKNKVYRWVVAGDWSDDYPTQYLCQSPDGGGVLSDRQQVKQLKEADTIKHNIVTTEQTRVRGLSIDRYDQLAKLIEPTEYMARKKIEAILHHDDGLRVTQDGALVVPTRELNGYLWGYQIIYNDGKKRFCRGQRMTRLCHIIKGQADKPVYVCEGYATGASVRLATGGEVVVVFNCHNMKALAVEIANKYHGREVVLCADNDQFKTDAGIKAAKEASRLSHNLPIAMPEFSENDLADKPTDYNDYHRLYGLDALAADIEGQIDERREQEGALVREAITYELPDMEKPYDKQLVINAVLDNVRLLHSHGLWYTYTEPIWHQISEREVHRIIASRDSRKHATKNRINEICYQISRECNVDKPEFNKVKSWEVPVANGVYNLNTKTIRPHSHKDMLDRCIPVAMETASCPHWLAALDEWFKLDPPEEVMQKKLALQMFFGYLLMPHAKYKKAMMLLGDSNTGKSVVQAIATALVGKEHVCNIPLEKMDDSRAIEPIVGAMLNNINEPSSGALFSDGGFKRLVSSGDEMVNIDPKHVKPYMYLPTAKHIIYTNLMPGVNDTSSATYNRLLILRFDRVFKAEEQDSNLIETLKQELTGILTWALAGAVKLHATRGGWPTVNSSEALILEHRNNQNQVRVFVNECCKPAEFVKTPVDRLWMAYKSNKAFGRISMTNFEQLLDNAGVTVTDDGQRKYADGIQLIDNM